MALIAFGLVGRWGRSTNNGFADPPWPRLYEAVAQEDALPFRLLVAVALIGIGLGIANLLVRSRALLWTTVAVGLAVVVTAAASAFNMYLVCMDDDTRCFRGPTAPALALGGLLLSIGTLFVLLAGRRRHAKDRGRSVVAAEVIPDTLLMRSEENKAAERGDRWLWLTCPIGAATNGSSIPLTSTETLADLTGQGAILDRGLEVVLWEADGPPDESGNQPIQAAHAAVAWDDRSHRWTATVRLRFTDVTFPTPEATALRQFDAQRVSVVDTVYEDDRRATVELAVEGDPSRNYFVEAVRRNGRWFDGDTGY